jgi:hypothetical protein
MQSPDEQQDGFSFGNISMGWLVAGLGVVVLSCVAVMLVSAFVIFTARRGERVTPLPPPATHTPTAVFTNLTTNPAPTVTLTVPENGRVTAVHLTSPPTIDGDLSEWADVPAFTSPHIVEQEDSWDGTLDITPLWHLTWDEQNLYLAVAVEDDVHVQTREAKFAYLGDSLEVQFDTNLQADDDPGVSDDDYQYVISPGNFADRPAGAFRFRGNAAGQMSDFIGSQTAVVAIQTADGYNLEAAIPWADLSLQAADGMVIGVAFSINDLDTPGTAAQELMLSHVASRRWLDPSSWGTLELEIGN